MLLDVIKARCEEKGITIAQLEREAHISNGVVRRWGTLNPRLDNLKAVADYFGVTVDELLKEEETA